MIRESGRDLVMNVYYDSPNRDLNVCPALRLQSHRRHRRDEGGPFLFSVQEQDVIADRRLNRRRARSYQPSNTW